MALNASFLAAESLEIGISDAIEYKYVCPEVHYQHNFPDILNKDDGNAADAFLSGVICSWPLAFSYLTSFFICYFSKFEITTFLYVNTCLLLCNAICDGLILLTYKDGMDIFRNHKLFYITHLTFNVIKISYFFYVYITQR